VTCLCNFNKEGTQNVKVTLRTPRKPAHLTAYGLDGVTHPEFTYDNGVCTFTVPIEYQDVKVVNAAVYAPVDAMNYWWKENQIAWRELKKSTQDFSKYATGIWRDPTQDLKLGWTFTAGRKSDGMELKGQECAADVLQFWGLAEGESASIRKTFDLDNPDWLKGGQTYLITGAWVGPNFMNKARITLNGTEITPDAAKHGYLQKEVASLLKPTGNVLEIVMDKPAAGRKFTGMNGALYLYHRDYAVRSMKLASLPAKIYIPQEWKNRYKIFLYLEAQEGTPQPPLGVMGANGRFARKHHHNFGQITDIDISPLVEYGADNYLTPILHGQPRKGWDWSKITLRLDLFERK